MIEELSFNDFLKKYAVYKDVPFEQRTVIIFKKMELSDYFINRKSKQSILPLFKPLYELN